MSATIIRWTETLMRDSFGDLTDAQFAAVVDRYEELVRADNPDADIEIEVLSDMVGAKMGIDEVEWSDGSTEPTSMYNDDLFSKAMEAADARAVGGDRAAREHVGVSSERAGQVLCRKI